MTWPFVTLIGLLVFGVLGALYLAYQNNCDEREHMQRMQELADEIAGIVR